MRKTAKYVAAMAIVKSAYPKQVKIAARLGNADLYRMLFEKGYCWDNREQSWAKVDESALKFMSGGASMFADADGNPSQLFNLRIMCNPAKLDEIITALGTGQYIVGRMDGPEPNRNGLGVRYYLNCRLPDDGEEC